MMRRYRYALDDGDDIAGVKTNKQTKKETIQNDTQQKKKFSLLD